MRKKKACCFCGLKFTSRAERNEHQTVSHKKDRKSVRNKFGHAKLICTSPRITQP